MSRGVLAGFLSLILAGAVLAGPPGEWWERSVQPGGEILDLYVDATFGDDRIGCGSTRIAWPCRSIQAALDRIPMVLTQDVVILVAEGTYDGGLLLADRLSPNRSSIELRGEEGAVVQAGDDQRIGMAIWNTGDVRMEGLAFEGFEAYGVLIVQSAPVEIVSARISGSGEAGILALQSATGIVDTVVEAGQGRGVVCEQGWMRIGPSESGQGLLVSGNAEQGLLALACEVHFAGAAIILDNELGAVAMHGAEIDLGQRSDVSVRENRDGQLVADCHGMIAGYMNTCPGECDCEQIDFGVCRAATNSAPGGPFPKPRIFDQPR